MNRRLVISSLSLFLALAACFMLWHYEVKRAASKVSSPATSVSSKPVESSNVALEKAAQNGLVLTPLVSAIMDAERAIKAGGDAKTILAALREELLAAGNSKASAAICEYLASGRDAQTGLKFVVGPNGVMVSVPTVRTFLMDLLASVDPKAALEQAEIVFDAKASADEYAICLRNVGVIDTSDEGRAYVGKRACELLSDSSLAASGSAGFAEAFDAVVYSADKKAFSLLASYTDKDDGKTLNFAAFLALDRMVIDDSEASIAALVDDSSILDDRPLTRAGLIARADLADDEQLKDVESYVLSLDSDGNEATYFFEILPNLNFTLTDGLLTDRVQISGDYVRERLEAALEAVDTWLSDKRFSNYTTQLQSAHKRIASQLGK